MKSFLRNSRLSVPSSLGLLALSLSAAAVLQADTIVSTVNTTTKSAVNDPTIAQGFTMGNAAYTLTDIQAKVGGSGSAISVDALLYSDNAGAPGSQLADLGSVSALSTNLNTWTPSSPFTLSANTTYWVVFEGAGNMQAVSEFNDNTTNTNGATIKSDLYDGITLTQNFGPILQSAVIFQVDGTQASTAPEPATFGTLAIGALALVGLRKRSSR